jgi:hypothetical protein
VVADVARRATSFWTRRASHPPADSGGRHHAFQTLDDNVHLDAIAASPLSSVPPSPSLTPAPDYPRAEGPYAHSSDPFSDPPGSSSSLFVNAQPMCSDIGLLEPQAPSPASSSPSSHPMHISAPEHATAHPGKVVGAPALLDLPKPRSPPPRTPTPHTKRPPEPFPSPDPRVSRNTVYDGEDEKPVRWWTEWLCGCSEGQDRGGEVQVSPPTYICPRTRFLTLRHRLAGRTRSNNCVVAPPTCKTQRACHGTILCTLEDNLLKSFRLPQFLFAWCHIITLFHQRH